MCNDTSWRWKLAINQLMEQVPGDERGSKSGSFNVRGWAIVRGLVKLVGKYHQMIKNIDKISGSNL